MWLCRLCRDERPQRPPVDGRERVRQEVRTRPQHVRDREPDPEVAVEVQQMPGLVAQAATGATDARRDDHHKKCRARGGEEHPGVVPHEVPCLRERVHARRDGVAEDEQHDLREEQPERPEADPAMHARDGITAEAALEQRHARHQEHLVQEQIGRDESRDAAERRERLPSPGEQALHAAAGDPQRRDEQTRRPDDGCRRDVPLRAVRATSPRDEGPRDGPVGGAGGGERRGGRV